ncbi:DUF1501 domain-containing protein [Gemmata sp.]|uniref:DUF1501 domain-containing protein n=1 Tax=Gemmata sp. TaxID=1914242 RepID=UPI003F7161AE
MPTTPPGSCARADHHLSRRLFLQGAGTGALGGFGRLFAADNAGAAAARGKHVILVFMSGGPSQFETWDPKTGRPTGGPHMNIQTAVPGLRIDEYMPNLARLANRTAVIRSMTSDLGDHMEGHYLAQTGHKPTSVSATAPHWLSVCAHEQPAAGGLPAYVVLGAESGGNMAVPGPGFLGAGHQGLYCPGKGQGPEDLPAAGAKELDAFRRREALRAGLGAEFGRGRGVPAVGAHDATFGAVGRLLTSRDLFDVTREPPERAEKYGPTALGRDCLLAARLVEKGVPFVRVQHQSGLAWDKHRRAFDSQRHLTREFDTAVGALIDDLIDRGLWETTLVVMMGEFGRTPEILGQGPPGRNHWTKSWSMSLGGCGVKPGVVVGSTNDDGTAVKDRPVTVPDLFATFYTLLGIDYRTELDFEGRPMPLTENGKGRPVKEVL